jgi:hypothetical protein
MREAGIQPAGRVQGDAVMAELDTSQWAEEYAKHVDRWLAGDGHLTPPAEFIAQKFAAHVVETVLAEQGWLAA